MYLLRLNRKKFQIILLEVLFCLLLVEGTVKANILQKIPAAAVVHHHINTIMYLNDFNDVNYIWMRNFGNYSEEKQLLVTFYLHNASMTYSISLGRNLRIKSDPAYFLLIILQAILGFPFSEIRQTLL